MNTLRDYQVMLSTHMGRTKDYHRWLLKHSETFTTIDKDDSIRLKKLHRSEIKSCYKNCAIIAVVNEGYDYYQGHVISKRLQIPLEHAFLVKENAVRDPTLAIGNRFGYEYYGIHIPKEKLQKYIFDKKLWQDMWAFQLYQSIGR